MIKQAAAIIGAIALIVLGAWYVSQPEQRQTIEYNSIKTDAANVYMASAPTCGWQQTSVAVGDIYVQMDASVRTWQP